jgi:polyhydroxyalkanoate synthesis regulator phasin
MDFNINNAMNTFNQQLGARVASGQMTMDQARAAQAEMTALQRMPNATREQATNVAQRQMQVGQYAPTPVTPQGGLTLVNVPQRLTLGNTPQPVEDTVGVNAEAGIPLWMRLGLPRPAQPATPMPQADTGFNINNAMNTFNQQLGQRVASGQMTLDQARAAQAEMTALQRTANPTREQATNVAQSQLQVGPYAPQPGMPRIGYRYPRPEAPQAAPMPMPPTPRMRMAMPRQPSGVNNSTFMAGDPNFRFGQTPQQMAPNAQGMAMGGLMAKYYGGAC